MDDARLRELIRGATDDVPDSLPPMDGLLAAGKRARARRRQRFVAASVALIALSGVAALAINQGRGPERPPTPAPVAPIPEPPAGNKWVGVGTHAVAVPKDAQMWPGRYCQPPGDGVYVTIVRAGAAPRCPVPGPVVGIGSLTSLGEDRGELASVQTLWAEGAGTPQSFPTQISLPEGWLAVPAGGPAEGVGEPTVADQVRALRKAGFRAVVQDEVVWGAHPSVRTVPEIGSPARIGTEVTVFRPIADQPGAEVSGRVLWAGDPGSGDTRGRAGMVHLVGPGLDTFVATDARGRWSFSGPDGPVTITARSLGFRSEAGELDACTVAGPVTLSVDQPQRVDVICRLG